MALNNLVGLSRRVSLYNGILCTHSSFYPIGPVIRLVSTMEQDKGFEPSRPAWKAGMLAVEHQSCIAWRWGDRHEGERNALEKFFSNFLYILYKKFYKKSNYWWGRGESNPQSLAGDGF